MRIRYSISIAIVLSALLAVPAQADTKTYREAKLKILKELVQYREARKGLVLEKGWSKSPGIYANKIKIIDLKIAYLEQEFARIFRQETAENEKSAKPSPPRAPMAPPPTSAKPPLGQFAVETISMTPQAKIPSPPAPGPAKVVPAPLALKPQPPAQDSTDRAPASNPPIPLEHLDYSPKEDQKLDATYLPLKPAPLESRPLSPASADRAPASNPPISLPALGQNSTDTQALPATYLPQTPRPLAPLPLSDSATADRAPVANPPLSLSPKEYDAQSKERLSAENIPQAPKPAPKPVKKAAKISGKKLVEIPSSELSAGDWLALDEAQQNRELLTELTRAMTRGITIWKPREVYLKALRETLEQNKALHPKDFSTVVLDQIGIQEPEMKSIIQVIQSRDSKTRP